MRPQVRLLGLDDPRDGVDRCVDVAGRADALVLQLQREDALDQRLHAEGLRLGKRFVDEAAGAFVVAPGAALQVEAGAVV